MTTVFHHPRRWVAGIHREKRRWILDKQCRECRRLSEDVGGRWAIRLTFHASTIPGIAFPAERPHL
ncbi:hypothetical protein ACTRXD_21465 [Nitrospira sp. T9]|uniref:hypothetical protein n=1 Tax=Nitrospira sp. T9 TaxID=3456077 RepID=UPI003F9A4E66